MSDTKVKIYVSIITTFVASIAALPCALFLEIGPFLIYGQSFASGSFLGISILNFLHEAMKFESKEQINSYSGFVVLGVFALLSLIEIITLHNHEDNQKSNATKILDDCRRNYSGFLMHRFSAFTSPSLQLVFFIIFLINTFLMGFDIYMYFYYFDKDDTNYILLFSVLVEKFIENFSLISIIHEYKISSWLICLISFVYSLVTPITILILELSQYKLKNTFNEVIVLVSTGIFFYIGILLWRKSFLTPFEWTKKEIILICLFFFLGLLIQAITCIPFSITIIKKTIILLN